jgi:hypothetical protein
MLIWNKDRPAGAHSLYLSANDGNTFTTSNPERLFTAINKTCADWQVALGIIHTWNMLRHVQCNVRYKLTYTHRWNRVADDWEAKEFHVRNHKQYGFVSRIETIPETTRYHRISGWDIDGLYANLEPGRGLQGSAMSWITTRLRLWSLR